MFILHSAPLRTGTSEPNEPEGTVIKTEKTTVQKDDATPEEQKGTERSYASLANNASLSFDPMKELNLPASYDEVTVRFKRLQGSRAMEVLN